MVKKYWQLFHYKIAILCNIDKLVNLICSTVDVQPSPSVPAIGCTRRHSGSYYAIRNVPFALRRATLFARIIVVAGVYRLWSPRQDHFFAGFRAWRPLTRDVIVTVLTPRRTCTPQNAIVLTFNFVRPLVKGILFYLTNA